VFQYSDLASKYKDGSTLSSPERSRETKFRIWLRSN